MTDVAEHQRRREEEAAIPLTSMQKFVQSSRFTLATTMLICINGIIIGIETDHGDGSAAWTAIEIVFLACYAVELALRFAADGVVNLLKTDGWVRFDSFVMFVALVDLCILGPAMGGGGGGEAKQIAMVLRITRLMKLARLVRLLKFFKELWLLVASFASAFKTLGWTLLLLVMVLYVFSILFVKMLKENEDSDIKEWFGNLGSAMFTLFQIGVTMDGWSELVRTVWDTDQWYMAVVLLFFMIFVTFAIMNTVLAVIVEHTLTEALDQQDDLIKLKEAELNRQADELLQVFRAADTDKGGTLSKEEFIACLAAPATRQLLQEMDLGEDMGTLDEEQISLLFNTIDIDTNHELAPQEFVNGMIAMRGEARARRIFELHCEILKLRNYNRKAFADVKQDLVVLRDVDPRFRLQTVQLTALEEKLDRGLAEQKKEIVAAEEKLNNGMAQVNERLGVLVAALNLPAQ